MAREIDPVVGEHGVRRRLEIRNRRRTGHEPARVVDVGAGEHGDDSGNRLRGAGIDAHNPRVGVRAPQDARMQHAGQPHVVGIGADPLHQPRIFDALHRPPDLVQMGVLLLLRGRSEHRSQMIVAGRTGKLEHRARRRSDPP